MMYDDIDMRNASASGFWKGMMVAGVIFFIALVASSLFIHW